MPLDRYRGITLQRELVDKIERYIKDYPEKGYKSIADFVTDAVRRRAEELRLFQSIPRFEHFNVYEDRVLIVDRKFQPRKILALRFMPIGENGWKLHCEHCDSANCEHVLYATTIPEVMNPPREKGWRYRGKYGEE